jgi:WD40 repeat protein/DNA-binding CsgD family transcriptional regulator
MPTSEPSGEPDKPNGQVDRLSAAAGQAARDRNRLRASEAAVASQVIAFQHAREPRDTIPDRIIESLSPREHEVLGLVAAGRSDGEIAEQLFISKKTASVHVASIKGKLGASSRIEIALFAAQLGLVAEAVAPSGTGRDARRGARSVCPFKGLASFDFADAGYFFGRERVVAELVARLAGSTFLGVVGPSGSGKSSVVRAGLVPALANGVLPGSEHWPVAILRPGSVPTDALRHALTLAMGRRGGGGVDEGSVAGQLDVISGGRRLLVVVDQFEEVFTLCRDDDERTAFMSALVELARDPMSRAIVMLAVRADFYGRCAEHRNLAELLGLNHLLIGPMTADDLVRAVELPARAAGLRVEPDLTSVLVADVLDEPGGLPLLSATLLELWQRREGRTIRREGYERIGGISAAVSRLAETAFGRLTADQQGIARAIFLRLAEVREDGTVVRRTARLAELDADHDRDTARCLAVLTDHRLVTTSQGRIEVAHEVLLREWPRLRGWLEEDAEGRRVREHLVRAAADWETAHRDAAKLYRGARLASAQEWAARHEIELNAVERAFLAASRGATERDIERQRRTNRRLRVLLAGSGLLLVVAIAAGSFAAAQLRTAQARALYASAIAVVEEDPELSMLLTLQGAALEAPNADTVTNLHRAVQASRGLLQVQETSSSVRPTNLGVALSPDGRTLFVSHDSGSIEAWDVETRRRVQVLGTARLDEGPQELDVALSPNGRRVATVDQQGTIHIWAWNDGAEQRIQAPGSVIGRPAFSHDGRRLAVMTVNGSAPNPAQPFVLSVWDLDDGSMVRRWTTDYPATVVFHPDGEHLLVTDCVCTPDRAFFRLDLSTGRRDGAIGRVDGIAESRPTAAQFSPDGATLATVGRDGKVAIWNVADGTLVRSFAELRDAVSALAFSPDGSRLATTSQDGTTRIWALHSGELLLTLVGQGGNVGSAWFSDDGHRVATGSSNLTARVWDLSPKRVGEVAAYELGPGFTQIVDLDRRGETIAVLGRSCPAFCLGQAAIVDLDTGRRMELVNQAGAAIALSPDGAGVLSQAGSRIVGGATATGPIRMYRLWSGDIAFELKGICPLAVPGTIGCGAAPAVPWDDQAQSFAFSPDSSRIVMRGGNGAVASWDATSGRLIKVIGPPAPYTAGPAFTPDGSLIATSQDNERVVLMDPGSLTVTHGFDLANVGRLRFSPDGSVLAVGSASFGTQVRTTVTWKLRRDLGVESQDLDFDAAGKRLATADTDGFIRLWDVASGSELEAIPIDRTGFGDRVGRVRFLDDERHVLTVDSKLLLVMTADTDELLAIAHNRVTRALTEAECQQYLHEACPAR